MLYAYKTPYDIPLTLKDKHTMNDVKKDIRYKTTPHRKDTTVMSYKKKADTLVANTGKSELSSKRDKVGDEAGKVSFDIFVNDKVKKITTALYMVTSFLSDTEPIKWKLRERAVTLMSDIASVRMHTTAESENLFAGFVVTVREIVSLLEVAAAAKLISEMNFTILVREYNLLDEMFTSPEYKASRAGQILFDETFFDTLHMLSEATTASQQTTSIDGGDSIVSRGSLLRAQAVSLGQKVIKDIKDKKKKTDKQGLEIEKKQERDEIKRTRRDAILALFKDNKGRELTIKDISGIITDCSEKTIQRELIALMAEGKIKKRGERRWSRYSLA